MALNKDLKADLVKKFGKDEMMVVMTDGTKVPVSKRKKERILEVINNL